MDLALRSLLSRPTRTALSVLGVAVGVGCALAFTSLARGFRLSLDDYARQTGADLVVFESRAAGDPSFGRISGEDLAALDEVPGVAAVGATAALPAAVEGRSTPILVLGRLPQERPIQAYRTPGLRGRLLQAPDEAMVGALLAQELGLDLGGRLPVLGHSLQVVGVYRTGVRWESGGAVVHLDVVREAMGLPQGAAMMGFVYVEPGSAASEVAATIGQRLPSLRVIPADALTSDFAQLDYLDAFAWVVSLGGLVVGAIGVLNTMFMNVAERVREIGTLRALGWSRGMVMASLLREGLALGLLGTVLGLLAGVGGALALARSVPQGVLQPAFPPVLLLQAAGLGLLLGLVGALWPAWRASRLAPAEALRHE